MFSCTFSQDGSRVGYGAVAYRLHVFASSSHRFTGLSASVVIGQNNYFGFGLTTLNVTAIWLTTLKNINKQP